MAKGGLLPIFEIFHLDVYTNRTFGGNPAAVIPLEGEWPPDEVLQSIAAENNLTETAFVQPDYEIRWFTPRKEVELCGHATVAAACVVANYLQTPEKRDGALFRFHSPHSGQLPVTVQERDGEAAYILELPADPVQKCEVPVGAARAVGSIPTAAFQGRHHLLFLLQRFDAIRTMRPDFRVISQLPADGVIVTAAHSAAGAPGPAVPAPGPDAAAGDADAAAPPDFGARFFAPQAGIAEDPVTASAHATLAPFWAERLGKNRLVSHQLSPRGGVLECRVEGDRVRIGGTARLYLRGHVYIDP